jgi:hypothetical protein
VYAEGALSESDPDAGDPPVDVRADECSGGKIGGITDGGLTGAGTTGAGRDVRGGAGTKVAEPPPGGVDGDEVCQRLVGAAGSASWVEFPALASATTPVPPHTASTAVAAMTSFSDDSGRRAGR